MRLCVLLVAITSQISPLSVAQEKQKSNSFSGGFNCAHQTNEGWVKMKPGQEQVVYEGKTVRRYRLSNQPASNAPSGLYVYFDDGREAVPPAPNAIDVEGKTIRVKNEVNVYRDFCWVSAP